MKWSSDTSRKQVAHLGGWTIQPNAVQLRCIKKIAQPIQNTTPSRKIHQNSSTAYLRRVGKGRTYDAQFLPAFKARLVGSVYPTLYKGRWDIQNIIIDE